VDAATGKEIHTILGHRGYVATVAFSPDGKTLASTDVSGNIMISDPKTGQQLSFWQAYRSQSNGLSFSPDGSLMATTSHQGGPRLWDTKSFKVVFHLPH
jgi:WD40 repeat protein